MEETEKILRIVVVETSDYTISQLKKYFSKTGHDVQFVNDLSQIGRGAEGQGCQAVIINLSLIDDQHSQLELIKKLYKEALIIILTLLDEVEVAQECLLAGADHFLIFPLDDEQLVWIINRIGQYFQLLEELLILQQQLNRNKLLTGQQIETAVIPNPKPCVPGASLDEVQRWAILKALEIEKGNRTMAATRLGLSLRTIRNWIRDIQQNPTADKSPSQPIDPEEEDIPLGTWDDIEYWVIYKTLEANRGNRTHTARILGITPRCLRMKINQPPNDEELAP